MSYALTITVTDDYTNLGVPDARIQVCSDLAGTVVLFEEYTETSGVIAFSVGAGTYYVFGRKAGYRFENPTTVVVAAATAQSIAATQVGAYGDNETTIANMALAFLSGGLDAATIEDINDESDKTAKKCYTFFEQARDVVITTVKAKHYRDLGAAIAEASLPEHAEWEYGFNLPSDYQGGELVATDEADRTARYDFEIVDRVLLTNDLGNAAGTSAYVRYVPTVVNMGLVSAKVRIAIAWKLAEFLAGPIQPNALDYVHRRYETAIGEALDEAGETVHVEKGSYSWLDARST